MYTTIIGKTKDKSPFDKDTNRGLSSIQNFCRSDVLWKYIYNGINLVKNELHANAVNDENLKF